jgi:aspartate/methionine/tyrosine aminotransferase
MKLRDFLLERYFAKHEFNVKYLLGSSDCQSMSLNQLISIDRANHHREQDWIAPEKELKELWLGYTDSKGEPQLREEISKLYTSISPEQVLVFSGAEEGIFTFMNSSISKGDEMIVQSPAYQSLIEIPKSAGAWVNTWVMKEENGWQPSLLDLKNKIGNHTKAIVINSPHNPTGYSFSRQELDSIISMAKENGTYVFSDEVYKGLEYHLSDKLPAVADAYEKGVSLGVMSKSFGLAGLRIGWIATKDKKLYDEMASFKDYLTICNSAPSEFLARVALRNKEFILKRNNALIQTNLSYLDYFFEEYKDKLSWVRPKAGAIAFPSINFPGGAGQFCEKLIRERGVMLIPSTKYKFGDRNFRIGFGKENFPEALSEFEEYLKER